MASHKAAAARSASLPTVAVNKAGIHLASNHSGATNPVGSLLTEVANHKVGIHLAAGNRQPAPISTEGQELLGHTVSHKVETPRSRKAASRLRLEITVAAVWVLGQT